MRQLIRSDGTSVEFEVPLSHGKIAQLIGGPAKVDTIHLRAMGQPAHLMVIDDAGYVDRKPVNAKASQIFWESCSRKGVHPIHGDVVIVPAAEFRI